MLAEYGISVSMSKRAEDEEVVEGAQPKERMLYIGADFYMHGRECPKFRGQGKSLARFEEVMKEWSAYSPGRLVPLLLLQRLIGMCLFHGRFQWRVRRYLNSGIRCIRERSGDHRVMSRAWQRTVTLKSYSSERWHASHFRWCSRRRGGIRVYMDVTRMRRDLRAWRTTLEDLEGT